MSRPLFSAPVALDFEVPLVESIFVTPVGSGRPSVRLCRGVVVRVVRLSQSGLVLGIEVGGRRFSVESAVLRAASPMGVVGSALPAPVVAPAAPVEDFPLDCRPVGWEPRHRARPGAAAGPAFRAPAPRGKSAAPASRSAALGALQGRSAEFVVRGGRVVPRSDS